MTDTTERANRGQAMTMLAYHGTVSKSQILGQLRTHALADEIVKGQYWENGKGCAVGCAIHSSNHDEYEPRFGIPQILAHLEDCIFEGLPNDRAKEWPLHFMGAIEPGQDLSRVGWQFLHWLLTDDKVNPGINHPRVRAVVKQCADVLVPLTKGGTVDESAWSAASAESAVRAAARAAESAWIAAESAAESAWSAASAWSAVRAAASAARAEAYVLMADRLIELIKEAPVVESAQ